MRKQPIKTQHRDPKTLSPRILSTSELQQAIGGSSNVMKSRHETAKNS